MDRLKAIEWLDKVAAAKRELASLNDALIEEGVHTAIKDYENHNGIRYDVPIHVCAGLNRLAKALDVKTQFFKERYVKETFYKEFFIYKDAYVFTLISEEEYEKGVKKNEGIDI